MRKIVLALLITGSSLLADVTPFRSKEGLYGIKNTQNKVLIGAIYKQVSRFAGNIAAVQLPNGMWGLIDNQGNVVSPCKYDSVSFFQEGMARVKFKGKYGYIDLTGKDAVTAIYDKAHHFENGKARVSLDGKWMLIDKKGTGMTLPVFDGISKFNGKVALVKAEGKYGLVDTEGKNLVPVSASDFKMISKELIGLNSEGWTVYRNSGEKLNDTPYENFDKVSTEVYKYKQDKKWGLIHISGKILSMPIFDDIGELKSGMIRVLDGKYGFVNDKGALAIAPKFDHATEFSNGLAQIRQNEKWAWINTKGETVIDNSDVKVAPSAPAKADNAAPGIEAEALRNINRAQQKIDKIKRATQPYYYNYNYYSPTYYNPGYYHPVHRPVYYYPRSYYYPCRSGIYYRNWGIGFGGGIRYYGGCPTFTIRF